MSDFLTTHQFAARIGVRAETVRRWCRAEPPKLVPAGRTPTGHYRFHPRQVAEVLGADDSQVPQSTSRSAQFAQALALQVRRDMQKRMEGDYGKAG